MTEIERFQALKKKVAEKQSEMDKLLGEKQAVINSIKELGVESPKELNELIAKLELDINTKNEELKNINDKISEAVS